MNCGASKAALIPYGGGIGPWSQEMVNAAWHAIGYPPPAPILPPTLAGRYLIATKGGRRISEVGKPKSLSKQKLTKAEGKAQNDFLNFWGKSITDPCRKQSGISKVAGAVLQVASFVAPVVGSAIFAVADAGNQALAAKNMGRDIKQATDILTAAAEQAYQPAPVTQLAPVQPAALPMIAPVSQLVPQPMSLVSRDRVSQVTQIPGSRWTRKDWAIAAGAGLFIYLLARRIQR